MTAAPPSAEARRYRPAARMSRPLVGVLNRFARPRQPFEGTLEGLALRIEPGSFAERSHRTLEDAAVTLRLGSGACLVLTLPSAALHRVVRAVEPRLDGLPCAWTLGMLLELAAAPLLDAVERIVGESLRIERVVTGIAPAPGAILDLAVGLDGTVHPAGLHLEGPILATAPGVAALLRLVEAGPSGGDAVVQAVPVPLALWAGWARLTLEQLVRLRPGDAVLPDRWLPSEGMALLVLGGACAARASINRHEATLRHPFGPLAQVLAAVGKEEAAVQETGMETPREKAETDGVEALEITLTFACGQRRIPVGALRELGTGHVFDLGLDPAEPVDVLANGRRIGRGEIVEIGETLGVRMVRLFEHG